MVLPLFQIWQYPEIDDSMGVDPRTWKRLLESLQIPAVVDGVLGKGALPLRVEGATYGVVRAYPCLGLWRCRLVRGFGLSSCGSSLGCDRVVRSTFFILCVLACRVVILSFS